jgi:hypothetical protein
LQLCLFNDIPFICGILLFISELAKQYPNPLYYGSGYTCLDELLLLKNHWEHNYWSAKLMKWSAKTIQMASENTEMVSTKMVSN